METTGQKLKESLRLTKFKYVYIRRAYSRSPRIYHIYLDSYLPNYKILKVEARNYETCQILEKEGDGMKRIHFKQPVLIEDFNDPVGSRDVFILFDAAGEYRYKDRDPITTHKKSDEPESIRMKIIKGLASRALTGGLM